MSSLIEKLDFFYKIGFNALLIGKHGVGKTSMIRQVFEKNGLIMGKSFLYFSASTLDPWVDLIGIPRETTDEHGNRVLDFVSPRSLSDTSEVEAIFLDEYNRAPKKVRNAVMELIQFKSINGKKLPKLKVVWAAINPDGEEDGYDVEQLDKAQKDRFDVPVMIPYVCDKKFFIEKYGENGLIAVDWWLGLPNEMKDEISPRRLDKALHMHILGGDIGDIIPHITNVEKLKKMLVLGPIHKLINKLIDHNLIKEAKAFISDDNNFEEIKPYLKKEKRFCEFFLPIIKNEKISLLMSEQDAALISQTVLDFVEKEWSENPANPSGKFTDWAAQVLSVNADKKLTATLSLKIEKLKKKYLPKIESIVIGKTDSTQTSNAEDFIQKIVDKDQYWTDLLKEFVTTEFKNISKEDALVKILFIHHYINTCFGKKINSIPCSLLVKVYNVLADKFDSLSCFSDPIFDTKVLRIGVKRNGKHISVN